jgi:multicomponent K+:H+ antiporter subunit A
MNHTALLLGILALPFIGSVGAACLRTNARNAEAWLAGAIAIVEIVLVSVLYPSVTDGTIARVEIEWIPAAGLNFAAAPLTHVEALELDHVPEQLIVVGGG